MNRLIQGLKSAGKWLVRFPPMSSDVANAYLSAPRH